MKKIIRRLTAFALCAILAAAMPLASAQELLTPCLLYTSLAALKRPCPPRGGEIGLLTCILPSEACALTLCARLSKGSEIIEQSQIPVYVGVKGMLEAAF